MTKKENVLGIAAALAANCIFGFSFIFSKSALKYAHPLLILAVRFTAAFLALNVLLAFKVFKISFKGKKITKLLLMSIAQPLLYFMFELYGLKLTSSALSGIIIALVPVGVAVFSGIFLGEKPNAVQIACSVLSLLGVAAVSFLSNDGSKNHTVGIILLAGAVITSCVFNLLSRDCSSEFSPFEKTYFMFSVAAVGFNIIAVAVLGQGYFTGIVRAFSNIEFICSIFYLSTLSSVFAFFLYNYSTSKITAVCSSSFSNIITVISVLAGVFILKEKFSLLQCLLCIPILLGVFGVNAFSLHDSKNRADLRVKH